MGTSAWLLFSSRMSCSAFSQHKKLFRLLKAHHEPPFFQLPYHVAYKLCMDLTVEKSGK